MTDKPEIMKPIPELQRVVCAAIKLEDGLIVTGARHFCPTMVNQMDKMTGYSTDDWARAQQGFIDQWGNFLTRQEAYEVANRQGQFKGEGAPHNDKILFSEDLY